MAQPETNGPSSINWERDATPFTLALQWCQYPLQTAVNKWLENPTDVKQVVIKSNKHKYVQHNTDECV